jgi:hypothetical protein
MFLGVRSLVDVSGGDSLGFSFVQFYFKGSKIAKSLFVSFVVNSFFGQSFEVVQLMKSFDFDFGDFYDQNEF